MEKAEFVEQWEGHVNELNRLKWNLPETHWPELEEIKNKLKELVGVAAEEHVKWCATKQEIGQ